METQGQDGVTVLLLLPVSLPPAHGSLRAPGTPPHPTAVPAPASRGPRTAAAPGALSKELPAKAPGLVLLPGALPPSLCVGAARSLRLAALLGQEEPSPGCAAGTGPVCRVLSERSS